METFLAIFHQTRDGNFVQKYKDGFLRSWFSLEIAGIGGRVHFFIYTPSFFKKMVESHLYAQYPDVEIFEVEDYTRAADFLNPDAWESWGAELGLVSADAYPIKTYIDYGLHETGVKEEQKIDPLASVLEVLGSLKTDEQVWIQILIRATKKNWKEEGKKLVGKILGVKGEPSPEEKMQAVAALSPGQIEIIKAIERGIGKLGFDVGFRIVYLARRDVFNFVNVASLMGAVKQYNSINLNGFRPIKTTAIDYFFKKQRELRLKRAMIDAYRRRSYFYLPYPRPSFVLNTEELATIYHFPGRVAETPTLERIEAKKGEPPANLPV
jgi:hypothetical protein